MHLDWYKGFIVVAVFEEDGDVRVNFSIDKRNGGPSFTLTRDMALELLACIAMALVPATVVSTYALLGKMARKGEVPVTAVRALFRHLQLIKRICAWRSTQAKDSYIITKHNPPDPAK